MSTLLNRHQESIKTLGLLAAASIFTFLPGAAFAALPYSLGAAANYAVLGIGGNSGFHGQIEVYQSGTVINGNVGAGPYDDWTHGIDATINGAVNYDTTDLPPTVTGSITGGVHQVSMASTVNAELTAEANYFALAPTTNFSTLNEDQVIVGNGGLNVIRITGDVTLKKTLTLQGTAANSFVFQLTASDATSAHELTLSGMTMILSGGVTANNVLWDMHGNGGGIVISSGADVDGIFLAPDRGVLVDASIVNGEVIGGGGSDANDNSMSVHSTSTITNVPEPGAGVLALLGL